MILFSSGLIRPHVLVIKIDWMLKQIRTGQAKIVFDMIANTFNIAPSR